MDKQTSKYKLTTDLTKKIYSILESSDNFEERMVCLDALAGIYYLSPRCFDGLLYDKGIFRNPFKRLSYLINEPVIISEDGKKLDYPFDSVEEIEKNRENAEEFHPFFFLTYEENEWSVSIVTFDLISRFCICKNTISYRGHGHTKKMQEEVVEDLTTDALEYIEKRDRGLV